MTNNGRTRWPARDVHILRVPHLASRLSVRVQSGVTPDIRRIKWTRHAARRYPRRKRNMRGIKRGRTRQMRLPIAAVRTWGGARKGAGRKPRGRPSMPHVTRPKVDPRFPVQVTIRATPGLPSLRSPRLFGALRGAIARASVDRFRVIHFSIQQDHAHFIVEGDEARRARGGVHGLAIRLALAVNRVLGRTGKVVGDRYHARPLTTPRQMRTSMIYVLLNFRKHLRAPACVGSAELGAAFFGVAGHSGGHGCSAGHGFTRHLDGACRLAARGRAVAGRRTPGRDPAGAQLECADVEASGRPVLNPRMLRRAGADGASLERCP